MSGRIEALHVAKASRLPMESRRSVEALLDEGLAGDRKARAGSRGQVTVVAAEQLTAAGEELGLVIAAGLTRRNVTVSGVPFPLRPGLRLDFGEAVLEVTGPAEPCRLMDELIGGGACHALRGRAGVRARVIRGGNLTVGRSLTVSERVR